MADTYPTTANCKAFLGASGGGDDAVIGWLLSGAIDFVERYCGRGFEEAAEQTIEVLPEYPNLLGKYRRTLLVRGYDLVAVTSITNGDGEAVTDYRLLPLDGPPYYKIEMKAGQRWSRGSTGDGVVTIEGTTGYVSVPDVIFEAILEMVAWLYRARSSGGGGPVTTATRQGMTLAPSEIPPHIMDKLNLYGRAK